MEASDVASESRQSETAPKKRSRWSISLGGVLIFAAGVMVGFAPMRAWFFFRDEPEFVAIEIVLFDADESETDQVRRAFAADPANDASRDLDPVDILRSRISSSSILSKPMVVTMIDREAALTIGGVSLVATSEGSAPSPRFVGIDASFTPRVRRSGKLELQYRIKLSSLVHDASGNPIRFDEVAAESSAVAEDGVWRLIEMKSPTQRDVEAGRCRWLLMRAIPVAPTP